MHYLNLRVRRDWQELELQKITAYQKLWLVIQGLVIISALMIFIVNEQHLSSPWKEVLLTILSSVFYLLIPIWVMLASDKKRNQKFLFSALLFIGAGLLGWFTFPKSLQSNVNNFSSLPVHFVLLVPLASGIWLFFVSRNSREDSRALGLRADNWFLDIFMGAAAGSVLGVHLLLTMLLVPGSKFPFMPDSSALLWLFCFQIGLSALGEEFLFRGLGFSLLFNGLKNPLWMVAIQLTVFNVLIYLVQVFFSPTIIIGFVIVLYRLLLSLMNTILRYQQGSVIPGIVSTTIVSLFLWIAVT